MNGSDSLASKRFHSRRVPLVLLSLLAFLLRAEASALEVVWNSATDVAVSSSGYTPEGAISFGLNFAPPVGTALRIVDNTGIDFIDGVFTNLDQGEPVSLWRNGIRYRYVADYFGGDGNDLVLRWAETRLVSCGLNTNGQLGDATTVNRQVFEAIQASGLIDGKTLVAVAAGAGHTTVLCSDGTMASWGWNHRGQLGNGTNTDSLVPVVVDLSGELAGKTVVSVVAAGFNTLVLCSDGTMYSWGTNEFGENGDGSPFNVHRNVPTPVDTSGILSGKKVVAIAAGTSHRLALCSDGTVVTWGKNDFGQLGNGSTLNSSLPVAVDLSGAMAGKTVVAIDGGIGHSVAICSDGKIATWGRNDWGQLGNNTGVDSTVPVLVDATGILSGKAPVELSCGAQFTIVRCSDGTVAGWGDNRTGHLGDNFQVNRHVPVAMLATGVLAGKTVAGIATGSWHSLILATDGSLATCGWNNAGQLGIGSSVTESTVPAAIDESFLLAGENVVSTSDGPSLQSSFAILAAPLPATIEVEQPPGSAISSNGSRTLHGVVGTPGSQTFTLRNTGSVDLDGIEVTLEGAQADSFVLSGAPPTLLGPGASATFVIQFHPAATGNRSAVVRIVSSSGANSPFLFNLTGEVLSATTDTDDDGLSDAAEFMLAPLGFDWQSSQVAMVESFLANSGLFTASQIQALHVDTALLMEDPSTGEFKLTLGLRKTTDLQAWQRFSFTAPDVAVNMEGEIEFRFTVPDDAAFFRVEAK